MHLKIEPTILGLGILKDSIYNLKKCLERFREFWDLIEFFQMDYA